MKRFELLKITVAPPLLYSIGQAPTDDIGYLAGFITMAFVLSTYFVSIY